MAPAVVGPSWVDPGDVEAPAARPWGPAGEGVSDWAGGGAPRGGPGPQCPSCLTRQCTPPPPPRPPPRPGPTDLENIGTRGSDREQTQDRTWNRSGPGLLKSVGEGGGWGSSPVWEVGIRSRTGTVRGQGSGTKSGFRQQVRSQVPSRGGKALGSGVKAHQPS